MNKTIQILDILEKQYNNPKTILQYSNIFELLVAVILSAQSTDEQVNRVTANLFKKYKNIEDYATANIDELEKDIKGVGLYKNKAKSLKSLALILLEKFDGVVPNNFDDLMSLPGVGRKTANVILAVGFDKPGLGVDTHVQRVANRLGIVSEKNPHKTEINLKTQIPKERWSNSHHLFIYHGRQVCKAKKPDCLSCVLQDICEKNL